MPFSLNATFVQDPDRKRIKDPATSPTNNWLLKRVGRLAGYSITKWLMNNTLDLFERAQAYGLLADPFDAEGTLVTPDFSETMGINTVEQLQEVEAIIEKNG